MAIELLLVQLLVLAFTGVLWWIARRDLASRALPAPPSVAATEDLEQLCATLEALAMDLDRRLQAVERQLAQAASQPIHRPVNFVSDVEAVPEVFREAGARDRSPERTEPEAEASQEARYAPVYALINEGVSDPSEIARRTGLSQGEVELIVRLRARRAL